MTSPTASQKSSTADMKKTTKTDRDDWANISESAERRRAQNRVSQRNHRQRIKNKIAQLEATIARSGEHPGSPPASDFPPVMGNPVEAATLNTTFDVSSYAQIPTTETITTSYPNSSSDVDTRAGSFDNTDGSFGTPGTPMSRSPSAIAANPGVSGSDTATLAPSPMQDNMAAMHAMYLDSNGVPADLGAADFPLWDYEDPLSAESIVATPESTSQTLDTSLYYGMPTPANEDSQLFDEQQRQWAAHRSRPVYPPRTFSDGYANTMRCYPCRPSNQQRRPEQMMRGPPPPWHSTATPNYGYPQPPSVHPRALKRPLSPSQTPRPRQPPPANSHYHLEPIRNGPEGSATRMAYVTLVMLNEEGRCPCCSCSHKSHKKGVTIRMPEGDLRHFRRESS